MTNTLLPLHDPHHGRLRLVRAIGGHALMRFLVLLFRLLGLDLVDFDAVFGVGEGGVEGEGVGFVDVFALWGFGEDAVAGAGEGLEGALEFGVV